MNDEFRKKQAAKIRALADKADPFVKRRLLDLAARYEQAPRPVTPLPKIVSESGEKDVG
jgi:hypothetical protein